MTINNGLLPIRYESVSRRRTARGTRLLAGLIVCLFCCGPSACLADEPGVIAEEPINDFDWSHWSFRQLDRPSLPQEGDPGGSNSAIDLFIRAKLVENGLALQPPADRTTALRRLSFDLTGLPPTEEAMRQFSRNEAPDAYQRQVDRLLASPEYGERWAQYWLDLARFADTDGFEHDKVRGEAWRYRDWVIGALNRDLPYDLFLQLQLAGDELDPGSEQSRIATAFCLSGPDMPDINLMDERMHNLLNEMTSTVGAVLLGLQVGCAQCHDHKYDPISQADFYRLRAVFEPSVQLEKNKSVSVLREEPGPVRASYLAIRGDFRRPGPEVQPAFLRIANPSGSPLVPVVNGQTSGRRTAFARWLTASDHRLTTRVIANRLWQHHFGIGLSQTPSDFGYMGHEPTHAQLLDWLATELPRRDWSLKSMHRLLVNSATYRQASHAGSSSAKVRDAFRRALEIDADNELLSRFPRRRLEGEVIRDTMLRAADMLSGRRGGVGVMPPLPAEMKGTLLKNQWKESPDPEDHHRRSIYVFARRNLRYPIFEAFDRPDANATCPQRNRSTTAPQSLLMINSEFSLTMARKLAGYILSREAEDLDRQIQLAYARSLSRSATPGELESARNFITAQVELLKRPHGVAPLTTIPAAESASPFRAAALIDLCLAMLNSNEFIYVD